jgi:hypothetical protein
LSYRPLRGGVAIANPENASEPGTLGLIATSDGDDRWIVSCYHVLARSGGGGFAAGEPIFQPYRSPVSQPVAETVTGRADPGIDCMAARVFLGVETTSEIVGLGPLQAPIEPVRGMRVLKSGIETGVTEGVVRSVDGDRVVIAVPPGFPERYDLSGRGDSGAVWVLRESGAPVALHIAGNDTGQEIAFGRRMTRVLEVLGLLAVLG